MSGGRVKQNPVEVATESPLVAPSLHKLDQTEFFQEMQMSLDGSSRSVECLSKGFHLRPTQPTLVVRVICKAAVGWDYFRWDTSLKKHCCFWYTGKFWLCRHYNLQ
jgi:hypothetical protein